MYTRNDGGPFEDEYEVTSSRAEPTSKLTDASVKWKGNINAFKEYTALRVDGWPTATEIIEDIEKFCKQFNCEYSCTHKMFVVLDLEFYCLKEDLVIVRLTCPEAIMEVS